jgi:hypothetical protein
MPSDNFIATGSVLFGVEIRRCRGRWGSASKVGDKRVNLPDAERGVCPSDHPQQRPGLQIV